MQDIYEAFPEIPSDDSSGSASPRLEILLPFAGLTLGIEDCSFAFESHVFTPPSVHHLTLTALCLWLVLKSCLENAIGSGGFASVRSMR